MDNVLYAGKKNKWPYDAESITENPLEYVYKTDEIKEFLSSDSSNWYVCGLRGFGKTLLLRAKRLSFLQLPVPEKGSYLFIPSHSGQELDSFKNFHPTSEKWPLLEDENNWIDIWMISIGLSIISNYNVLHTYPDDIKRDIERIPTCYRDPSNKYSNLFQKLIEWTLEGEKNPSFFVSRIITMLELNIINLGIFNQIASYLYDILFSKIHSGVVVFIDRVDKPFDDLMYTYSGDKPSLLSLQKIWHSSQIGLIIAIDNYCSQSHHIKIYTSIRQEILGKLKSNSNFARYKDHMLILKYSKEDLKEIFIRGVKIYELDNLYDPKKIKSNPIFSFLGLNKLTIKREINDDIYRNYPIDIPEVISEDIFDYMYRHSIQRPRDIIHISGAISGISIKNRKNDNILREINNEALFIFQQDYLLDLKNIQSLDIKLLLKYFKFNFLSLDQLVEICNNYNNDNQKTLCNFNCLKCRLEHIHTILYNYGIIGIIKQDDITKEFIQRFLDPSERYLLSSFSKIPQSLLYLYLMHPLLTLNIKSDDELKDLFFEIPVIIGHERVLSSEDLGIIVTTLKIRPGEENHSEFSLNALIEAIALANANTHQKTYQDYMKEANSKSLTDVGLYLTDKIIANKNNTLKWLDVGCGNGRCLEILSNFKPDDWLAHIYYDGIDLSSDNFQKIYDIQRRIKNEKLEIHLHINNIADIDLDKKYDLITSILLIHEVNPIELPYILKKLLLSLKDYGVLIITDFEEPFELEKKTISWNSSDIRTILKEALGIDSIPRIFDSEIEPNELKFYTFIIRSRPSYIFDDEKFNKFISKYTDFLINKKDNLIKQREKIIEHINEISQIYFEDVDIDIFNMPLDNLNKFAKKLNKVDRIKSYKQIVINEQIHFLINILNELQ